MIAGRSSPMRISGMPSSARTEIERRPSAGRSADTEALRGDRFDEDQVLGRVEVDGERRRRARRSGRRRPRRASRCAARLPGPKAKSMTSGGRSAEGVGPRAVAVGDEHDGPAAPACGAAEGVEDGASMASARDERQVDRQDQDRVGATGDHVVACRRETRR